MSPATNCVDTDLRFEDFPQSVTPALVLSHVLQARANLHLSARYLSEYVTSPVSSKIIRLRRGDFLDKREVSKSEIEAFQDFHFRDGRAIRRAINSGERSFDDFLKLLDTAARFKTFLREANPDQELLRKYLEEVAAKTWLDKLPTKTVRWTGLAPAG